MFIKELSVIQSTQPYKSSDTLQSGHYNKKVYELYMYIVCVYVWVMFVYAFTIRDWERSG